MSKRVFHLIFLSCPRESYIVYHLLVVIFSENLLQDTPGRATSWVAPVPEDTPEDCAIWKRAVRVSLFPRSYLEGWTNRHSEIFVLQVLCTCHSPGESISCPRYDYTYLNIER